MNPTVTARRSWLGPALLIVLLLLGACARSPEARKARHLDRGDGYFKQQKYREAVLEYTNALRIETGNRRGIRQLGLAHYELGDLKDAFRYLQKAQELDPADVDVRLKLGHIYLAAARPDDARAQAQVVLQTLPKNLDALGLMAGAARTPEEIVAATQQLEAVRTDLQGSAAFHLILADLHLRSGRADQAEAALREAVDRAPKSIEAHSALGQFYAGRRDNAQAERELKAAADLAPPGSAARVRLAEFYFRTGRRAERDHVVDEIIEKAPEYLPAWRLRASVAFSENRIDDSAKAVRVVLKKNPSDVDARLLLGRIHLVRGNTDQAISELQWILRIDPRLPQVHYQLALAHLQAGNVQQAKQELREAVADAPGFVEATLLLADLNIQGGVGAAAISDLEGLVSRGSATPAAYGLLASAYLNQKEPARALAVARELTILAPKDSRGFYLTGLALVAQGKRAEARRQLEAALELSPALLEPLTQLVVLDLAENQPQAALDRVTRQAALAPMSGAHQALLGQLYLLRGERALAETTLLKAIELSPRLLEPYVRLGGLYAEAQRYDEALARFEQAAKARPKDPAPLMLAGVVYEKQDKVEKAREAYEKVLALNPRFVPAANNLAWLHSERGGDRTKALTLAQTARDLAPDDPRVADTLGWILYRRGVHQRALTLLKESASKLPDNPQVQYHLGMVFAQLEDRDNARRHLAQAVTSPEAFLGKDEARKTLAELR